LELTPRLALWLQPEAQGFRADTPIPGGLLSLQAAFPLGQGLRAWVEAEGKTQGWVEGVEPLDAALSARLGALGVTPEDLAESDRRLVRETRGAIPLRFLLLKPDDVPTYVEHGAALDAHKLPLSLGRDLEMHSAERERMRGK
jgi:hypothetical protein